MENNFEASAPSIQPPPKPLVHKSEHFFSLLGKIALSLIIVGSLIFGGYYLGTRDNAKQEASAAITPTQSATNNNMHPTEAPTPTTAVVMKTIKAGLASGTSFKSYALDIPNDWTDTHENDQAAGIDKLTLTKNGYTLSIYQAAFGGSGCIYKGDPPHEMAQSYTNFADIVGKTTQFRRSWNQEGEAKTKAYSVCQKNTTDNSYGSPTEFGAISIVVPNPSEDKMLAEIDSIIASITKQ